MSSTRRKLIEVALPLEAINRESAREKSIRHGHPSTLHLWWSRKPLATCRAVLFASLVDDPDQSGVPEALLRRIDRLPMPELPREEWSRLSIGEQRRQRLFTFIEKLVKWENSNNEAIVDTARDLILAATGGNPPPVLDPFCGGGSIPLEAQRLGLEAHASDLNPVAVLITKALIEIPPKFAGRPPVNPVDRARGLGTRWKGASGLAADVRYYGEWMRDEAERRIGHLYPKVRLPKEQGGVEATVIAWLWARTVKCPNPACGAQMPLTTKFWLSTKAGQNAWVEPIVDKTAKTVRFEVRIGQPDQEQSDRNSVGTGVVKDGGRPGIKPRRVQATFRCPVCSSGIATGDYIDGRATIGEMGEMPLAIVAEGSHKRIYVEFDPATAHRAIWEAREFLAKSGNSRLVPDEPCRGTFASNAQGRVYGFATFGDYFASRQLSALTTFSELLSEARNRAMRDAAATDVPAYDPQSGAGGIGPAAYANAVVTYLALAVDRMANTLCTIARWTPDRQQTVTGFSRQAIQMAWDFPDVNPFAGAAGDFVVSVESICKSIERLPASSPGYGVQRDATTDNGLAALLCSTDPPYYDNVGYADLSDFFYVWLRRSLSSAYPELFGTLLVPKAQELVATPYRFEGSREKAKVFFENGLGKAFAAMRSAQHPEFPLTVYYAFKQAETDESDADDIALGLSAVSTGWETMLEGLIRAGFAITGTWPMRSELSNRMLASGTNALASSIVLACRPRAEGAALTTRRDFLRALHAELPLALRTLQQGNIAPVDLAQAAIGPGMAVFSRYSKVLEPDGQSMKVRTALALINQALDEVLAEQEGEYDADTRWAIAWFSQRGHDEGPFGEADVLSRAKNTAVGGMVEAGIVEARAGKVRLLRRSELTADWDPARDSRLTVWEATQHLIRALDAGGEEAAADLLRRIGGLGDTARDLAYRLYVICERKRWTQEAIAYNGLVIAWPELARLAARTSPRADRLL